MRRIALISAAALLWLGTYAPAITFSHFQARTQGSTVVVEWQTSAEVEVESFVLERKRPYDPGFTEVRREPFAAHGAGRPYRFEDTSVYKAQADQVTYQLRILFKDGSEWHQRPSASADYTSTAVRRTWGSIKAMFQ